MLGGLVGDALARVPLTSAMEDLAEICRHDRYQASHGINAAARFVAERAREAGLADVWIHQFPADGARHWWTFRAPVSWTPTQAILRIVRQNEPRLIVDHEREPFALATYSAPSLSAGTACPLVNIVDAERRGLSGAIVLIGRDCAQPLDRLVSFITERGACGFATDGPARRVDDREFRGRVELRPDCRVFGFSLTSDEMRRARAAAEEGAHGEALVQIDRAALMPVVTGVVPGAPGQREVWLTSHLCHPRPGANDNASGSAALLALARMMRAPHAPSATVRFVWGPEYLGVAALLHERECRSATLPQAVVNLDMVAEDQARCGSPFVIERAPDTVLSLINPLAERIVQEVFEATSAQAGRWEASAFMGFSDHALFADPRLGVPAVQLCHVPDRFNHSAADTFDKVCAEELRRSVAAAFTLVSVLADERLQATLPLQDVVRAWCAREIQRARECDAGDRVAARGLLEYTVARNERLLALVEPGHRPGPWPPECLRAVASDEQRIASRWSGPLNLRELLDHSSAEARARAYALVRRNKDNLALLFSFAILADGRRTRSQILQETAYARRWQLEPDVAATLMNALEDSTWVHAL
ncbi:MAG: DUF4910 domain-containing protein [Gammaproteobacteria bacterium]